MTLAEMFDGIEPTEGRRFVCALEFTSSPPAAEVFAAEYATMASDLYRGAARALGISIDEARERYVVAEGVLSGADRAHSVYTLTPRGA